MLPLNSSWNKDKISKVKNLESSPSIHNFFSLEQIEKLKKYYFSLSNAYTNSKQNVRKAHATKGLDSDIDKMLFDMIDKLTVNCKIDNEHWDDSNVYGIFHESFSPLKIHCDSGTIKENIPSQQILIPMTPIGETILLSPRWYDDSSNFTINKDELSINENQILPLAKKKPYEKTNRHLGDNEFDRVNYQKYFLHEDINNLKGLKVHTVYKWKLGDVFIFDRTFIHCSANLKEKKIGLSIFLNQKNDN